MFQKKIGGNLMPKLSSVSLLVIVLIIRNIKCFIPLQINSLQVEMFCFMNMWMIPQDDNYDAWHIPMTLTIPKKNLKAKKSKKKRMNLVTWTPKAMKAQPQEEMGHHKVGDGMREVNSQEDNHVRLNHM